MTFWLNINGRVRKVELDKPHSGPPSGNMLCLVDGLPIKVEVQTLTPTLLSLILLDSQAHQFCCILDTSPEGEAIIVNGKRVPFAIEDPRSLRARRGPGAGTDGPRAVKSPMPGRVVRVLVSVGDEVTANQGLVVIEAMKMQNELKSPKAGRIVRIAAQVGETVQSGDVLVIVE